MARATTSFTCSECGHEAARWMGRCPGRGEVAERHAGQRRLADAWRAAEQDDRAGDEAAAEHPIELAEVRLRTGRAGAARPARAGGAVARASSTSVFQAPQPGQRPIQRAASCPHSEQVKEVVARAMPQR